MDETGEGPVADEELDTEGPSMIIEDNSENTNQSAESVSGCEQRKSDHTSIVLYLLLLALYYRRKSERIL